MRLVLSNGDTFSGKTATDLLQAWNDAVPQRNGDPVDKFVASMMPYVRSFFPLSEAVPDPRSHDAFLALVERAKLGTVYRPGGSPPATAPLRGLAGFGSALGAPQTAGTATSGTDGFFSEVPQDLSRWPVIGNDRRVRMANGGDFYATRTVDGWEVTLFFGTDSYPVCRNATPAEATHAAATFYTRFR